MDDKEYYTLMNKMPSAKLFEEIQRKNKKKENLQKNPTIKTENSFNHLEAKLGRDDAEMLMENQRG